MIPRDLQEAVISSRLASTKAYGYGAKVGVFRVMNHKLKNWCGYLMSQNAAKEEVCVISVGKHHGVHVVQPLPLTDEATEHGQWNDSSKLHTFQESWGHCTGRDPVTPKPVCFPNDHP